MDDGRRAGDEVRPSRDEHGALRPWFARRWVRRSVAALAVVLYVVAAVLTHLPGTDAPLAPSNDKVLHFVGYFGLGAALVGALWVHGVARSRRLSWALAALPVYAAVDELTQTFVARDASVGDWLANVAGIVVATAVVETMATLVRRGAVTARGPGG